MLTHSYDLWNKPQLEGINFLFQARFAIDSFFVISGFFIFNSCERSKNLKNFFLKRALRIYPAYICALLLIVVLATVLTKGAIFARSLLLVKYLGVNLLGLNFLQPVLPGVFESNHHPAINGALWTLKVEFMFYASVPILIWISKKWNKNGLFVVLYIISQIYYLSLRHIFAETGESIYMTLARQFPGKMALFVAGGLLFYNLEAFKKKANSYLVLGIFGLVLWWYGNIWFLYPICIAVIVVYLGSCVPYLGNIRKIADFSVGIFLYHFPVMQTLIFTGKFDTNPIAGVVAGALIVYALAYISWHLIEKPFLSSK